MWKQIDNSWKEVHIKLIKDRETVKFSNLATSHIAQYQFHNNLGMVVLWFSNVSASKLGLSFYTTADVG